MPRPTIPLDELATYLFGADDSLLTAEVGPWLVASPRFRGFAEMYRDKIRKKVRGVRDGDGQHDLAFELGVAVRLLGERRLTVEYEPYGMDQRAPDFRVTFRSTVRFNVEVRRLRRAPSSGAPGDEAALVRAVCDKLGQLPPAMINVLVLGAGPSSAADAVAPAMLWLQERAAQKDEALFVQRGFTGVRDFLRHYQRLSAALWLAGEPATPVASLWRNPQARHPLPVDLARVLASTTPT
jgi:hypothetical protein